jgi:hypothetical protein
MHGANIKINCDNCVCKSYLCLDVWVTVGVRLKAASVYHTSAGYRNFEEYEDAVLQPLNISLQTSVAFNSALTTVSGKEVTLQKRLLYLRESTKMHFKPHVFV